MKSGDVRTPWLIGIVLAVHVVLVGGFMLIQGCGTTLPPAQATTEVKPVPVEPPMPIEPIVKPMPVEPPAPATVSYAVEKGDSVSLIAKRFGVSQAEILAMNGIRDANKLRVGQKLKLPGHVNLSAPRPKTKRAPKKAAPVAAEAQQPAAAPAAGAVDAGNVYVVQKGDALSKIAKKHGTTSAAIRKANNLTGDMIRVGQKLALPGAEAKAEAAPAPVTDEPKPVVEPAGATETAPAPEVAPEPGTPSSAPDAAPDAALRKHTVEQGEDLTTIAYMYGVDVGALKQLNSLQDATLKAGQVLSIPMAE